jgi:hypothetical protein
MTTITLLIILAVAAGVLYLAGGKIDATIRKIIWFILVVCAVVWFLSVMGVLPAQMSLK